MRSFFPGAVATVALWKSAPVENLVDNGAHSSINWSFDNHGNKIFACDYVFSCRVQ